jgi:hypothetical protein
LQGNFALEDISAILDEFMVVHERDRTFAASTDVSKADIGEQAMELNYGNLSTGISEAEEAEEDGFGSDESGCEDYMPDYFKLKVESKWDCESIVSTYSNLDNHPVRVAEKPKKKSQSLQQRTAASSDAPKRITLSNKSGLPLGVLPERVRGALGDDDGDDDVCVKDNKGKARSRVESKEDKRLRKSLVKLQRQQKRESKSSLKGAFKADELGKQKRGAEGTRGVAVFKY